MDHVPPARQHDADGAPTRPGSGGRPRPDLRNAPLIRVVFLALCLALAAGFGGLGVWQVERLQWKTALIRTVEARLAAPPTAAPGPGQWSPADAYTKVIVNGVFDHTHETSVMAVTEQGPGWWIVTPLRTSGGTVLVNRGFVPGDRRDPATRAAGQVRGPVSVVGLLRASEPNGGFLRRNDPAAGRWYSRDVQAIARAQGLAAAAPYFIDADATPNEGGYPIGGLTVVRFSNSHLVYALTWFGLCLLSLIGAGLVIRRGWR